MLQHQQDRINKGLCYQCGHARGTDGTARQCRRCADKARIRTRRCRDKKIALGLCILCSGPRGEDSSSQTCRSCSTKLIDERAKRVNKDGLRPQIFIRVNGRCLNCGKTFEYSEEYEACDICHFKNLARLYLGSTNKWQAIQILWIKHGSICPYTGLQLGLGIDACIDHILPSSRFPELAQDITNMEFVHYCVNGMKQDMTKEEFIDFITMIGDKRINKDAPR